MKGSFITGAPRCAEQGAKNASSFESR